MPGFHLASPDSTADGFRLSGQASHFRKRWDSIFVMPARVVIIDTFTPFPAPAKAGRFQVRCCVVTYIFALIWLQPPLHVYAARQPISPYTWRVAFFACGFRCFERYGTHAIHAFRLPLYSSPFKKPGIGWLPFRAE